VQHIVAHRPASVCSFQMWSDGWCHMQQLHHLHSDNSSALSCETVPGQPYPRSAAKKQHQQYADISLWTYFSACQHVITAHITIFICIMISIQQIYDKNPQTPFYDVNVSTPQFTEQQPVICVLCTLAIVLNTISCCQLKHWAYNGKLNINANVHDQHKQWLHASIMFIKLSQKIAGSSWIVTCVYAKI